MPGLALFGDPPAYVGTGQSPAAGRAAGFFGLSAPGPAYVGDGQPPAAQASAGFFSWLFPGAPRYLAPPDVPPG